MYGYSPNRAIFTKATAETPHIASMLGRYINDFFKKTGAGEGIRTLDPNLGKVVLYP